MTDINRAGTYIRQTWDIADGVLMLTIRTTKPMDSPAYEALQNLVDAIETFANANQAALDEDALGNWESNRG